MGGRGGMWIKKRAEDLITEAALTSVFFTHTHTHSFEHTHIHLSLFLTPPYSVDLKEPKFRGTSPSSTEGRNLFNSARSSGFFPLEIERLLLTLE